MRSGPDKWRARMCEGDIDWWGHTERKYGEREIEIERERENARTKRNSCVGEEERETERWNKKRDKETVSVAVFFFPLVHSQSVVHSMSFTLLPVVEWRDTRCKDWLRQTEWRAAGGGITATQCDLHLGVLPRAHQHKPHFHSKHSRANDLSLVCVWRLCIMCV